MSRAELQAVIEDLELKLERARARVEELEQDVDWDVEDEEFIAAYHEMLRESLECTLRGVDLGHWEYVLIGGQDAGELMKERAPVDYRCGAVDYQDSLEKDGWKPRRVEDLEEELEDLKAEIESMEEDLQSLEEELEELEDE
jgi:predicted RNase H-like nuclease (RuvC/YqgF family)